VVSYPVREEDLLIKLKKRQRGMEPSPMVARNIM